MSSIPLIIALPGNDAFAASLGRLLPGELGAVETRAFPDGETYARLSCDPRERDVVLVCTLDRPDPKTLPLLFVAATARELGARSVGLVAPYLAYMRQDKRFREGEALTAAYFAKLISSAMHWLVTVDPHLHRYRALSDIYSIPSRVVHAGPVIARWVETAVPNPVIIGPDSESAQWVAAVAASVGAPYRVLSKVRGGDRAVTVSVPDLTDVADRTPVLLDDILSSGRTMIETADRLAAAGGAAPICIAVHALAGPEVVDELLTRAAVFVSTNTVQNAAAQIDITASTATAVRAQLASVAA